MGGAMSRNKGARAERDIKNRLIKLVDDIYSKHNLKPPKIQRNGNQADGGGYDIVGLDWLAIEVKHQEVIQLPQWWRQTLSQTKEGQLPVLFYRKNRMPWYVKTHGEILGIHKCEVTLAIDDFLQAVKVELDRRLQEAKDKHDNRNVAEIVKDLKEGV